MDSASTSIKTLDAVVDLAIAMEREGRNYYASVRDNATDPKCKEFFSWLVDQEEDHQKTYLQLLEGDSDAETSSEEIIGSYGHFIQRLVKEVTETLNEYNKLSIEEAIQKALFFEESVIKYFQKVKVLFADEHSNVIQKICDEEQEHIDAIMKYRAEMQR